MIANIKELSTADLADKVIEMRDPALRLIDKSDTTNDLPARLRSRAETVDSESTSKLLSDAADEIEMWRERDANTRKIATALEIMKMIRHD